MTGVAAECLKLRDRTANYPFEPHNAALIGSGLEQARLKMDLRREPPYSSLTRFRVGHQISFPKCCKRALINSTLISTREW